MNTVNNFFACGEPPKDIAPDFELMRAMIGDDKPRRVFPVIEEKGSYVMANTAIIKYILVIKGVSQSDYQGIKEDLVKQYEAKEIAPPFFVHLPGEYPEMEVLWIDEEMEKHHYALTVNSSSGRVIDDFRTMQTVAGA